MNASIFNNNPRENTVPPWLLPCTCLIQRCTCNAHFRPYILCIKGHPYQGTSPPLLQQNLIVQFVGFTHTNDRFSNEKIITKQLKYQPLLEDIKTYGWNIDPLIVITASVKGTTHSPSISALIKHCNMTKIDIIEIFVNINTIAIRYLTSIILHKRRLKNNQPLLNPYDPP